MKGRCIMVLHRCLLLLSLLGLLLSPSSALSAAATTRNHSNSSTSTSSTRLRRAEARFPGPHSTTVDDILTNIAKEVNVTQSKPIEAIEAKLATKERSDKQRVQRRAKRSKENKVPAPLDRILDPDPYYDCTTPRLSRVSTPDRSIS